MIILYLHRKDKWDSLKWSLRSLQHIEHTEVWVVGDKVRYDVRNIITHRQDERYRDSNYNFRVGTQYIPYGSKVLLMHDDMYLLPGYEPKKYYKGSLKDYPIGGDRGEIFKNTQSFTDMNYGLHYPMPFVNDFTFEFDNPVSIMSFLGTRHHFESVQSDDCKFKVPTLKNLRGLPCFSTYNETDDLKPLMLNLYPNKSIFE